MSILRLQDDDEEEAFTYRGETLKIRRALNPTNVLWENFEFTKNERKFRYTFTILAMIGCGIAYFFFATYALQVREYSDYLKSPPSVNCETLLESYSSRDLERISVMETLSNVKWSEKLGWKSGLNEKMSHTGAQSCYCQDLHESGVDLPTTN